MRRGGAIARLFEPTLWEGLDAAWHALRWHCVQREPVVGKASAQSGRVAVAAGAAEDKIRQKPGVTLARLAVAEEAKAFAFPDAVR